MDLISLSRGFGGCTAAISYMHCFQNEIPQWSRQETHAIEPYSRSRHKCFQNSNYLGVQEKGFRGPPPRHMHSIPDTSGRKKETAGKRASHTASSSGMTTRKGYNKGGDGPEGNSTPPGIKGKESVWENSAQFKGG